jgi:hypothetical protein
VVSGTIAASERGARNIRATAPSLTEPLPPLPPTHPSPPFPRARARVIAPSSSDRPLKLTPLAPVSCTPKLQELLADPLEIAPASATPSKLAVVEHKPPATPSAAAPPTPPQPKGQPQPQTDDRPSPAAARAERDAEVPSQPPPGRSSESRRVLVINGKRVTRTMKRQWNRAEEGTIVAMLMLSRKAIDPLSAITRPNRGAPIDLNRTRVMRGPSRAA